MHVLLCRYLPNPFSLTSTLTSTHLNKYNAPVITIDVHNRDITHALADEGAASPADFAWQRQLRYEFDPDTDAVVVRQASARCVRQGRSPSFLQQVLT